MVDVDIPLDTGDFRLMNRHTVDTFKLFPEQFRFIRGLVSWIGGNQVPLLYDRKTRFAGKTHYPLRKMLRFAIDAITGFSISASAPGILYWPCHGRRQPAACCFTRWEAGLTGSVVTGWTSLTSIVLIIGSIQLLVLGIFGEYLGRMYLESKRRPLFIVREIIETKRDD